MLATGKAIQYLVVFSAALGVLFLWEVYPLLPAVAFDLVAVGWGLFVIDSALTFLRPRASYYLAFALALLALSETLTQPAHYQLLGSTNYLAQATLIAGAAAQVLIIVVVPLHFLSLRGKQDWSWPGAKSPA